MEKLLANIRQYDPSCDLEEVRRAFQYAESMHGDQKRESGEAYIIHPLSVALILSELEMDLETIQAALLHDCIEDTDASYDNVEKLFGSDVAMLVDGVTKLENIEFHTKDEQKAESLRKMFFAMAKDIRVVIIKLADRLHNMRTLKYRDESKRMGTARETLEVYAPLASRLGIYSIKWELEDLSLRYLNPDAYYDIVDKVAMNRGERQKSIEKIMNVIRGELDKAHIQADIEGRPKHFYSIYNKMKQKALAFDQIYDLIAVRVIVDSIRDCYAVLGIVHSIWKPIPGRFKDYISVPKPNQYQSLHTTLIGENGTPFEIQIRTHEMHRVAEYGIAAHWKYKEGNTKETNFDAKLTWLRQFMDVQGEMGDAAEFMDTLKMDLFSQNDVFVFTPKGDAIDLPIGSTPLDFAYRIHSQVGHHCVGAKVNQRIVTLDTVLHTGDIVEIITSASAKGPTLDWLKIVKTSQAKSKIRAFLKNSLREDNIQIGREMVEREVKRQNFEIAQILKREYLENILDRFAMHSVDDLYASVGFGGLSSAQVVNRLVEEYRKDKKNQVPAVPPEEEAASRSPAPAPHRKSQGGVFVKGEDNMLVRFAKCCNPVPGDKIVGFITRGRGVSVHRADCSNVVQMQETDSARLVEVSWDTGNQAAYNAEIQIVAYDQIGVLAMITNYLAQIGIPLIAVSARRRENTAIINLTIEITGTDQLEKIIAKLNKTPQIFEVFRLSS
ncbi:MAG: bifunctional (p)ppGpp synthetase/guanosine-3',5'-bis(diphosphate) 3'-pyrophosphohydrolase [Clostridia bacterium]|nr:bifunctional (p)ppGpp synthetase/guanosine-3',5'-bis(diphosphate) 3'-pyrophosphohydrolase [Clostridia bacterium]